MIPRLRHFRVTLLSLGFAALLPAAALAQPPVYLTQWGSMGSAAGQFNEPLALATDAAGDVYVGDYSNNRIQKFTGAGAFLTQWGTLGTGNGQFIGPAGVATDLFGNVFVADQRNNRIQKFTSTGTYLGQWGSLGTGSGQFDGPTALATDAAGNLYVADSFNNRIQVFTGTGTYLTQWGSSGTGNGQFDGPFGIAVDVSGDVLVADLRRNRIQRFTGSGTYLTQWGSSGAGNGQFFFPSGVAVHSGGNLYVADGGNHRVQEFTNAGAYLAQWGSFGSGNGQFNVAYSVAVDAAGNVFVADAYNHRIQKFGAPPPTSPSGVGAANPASVLAGGTTLITVTVAPGQNPVSTGLVVKADLTSIAGGPEEALFDDQTHGDVTPGDYTFSLEVTVGAGTPDGAKILPVSIADDQLRSGVTSVPLVVLPTTAVPVTGSLAFGLDRVSPNPARGDLVVGLALSSDLPARLELVDIAGRAVATRVVSLGPGAHHLVMNEPARLAPGLYLVRLTQGERSASRRVVVTR